MEKVFRKPIEIKGSCFTFSVIHLYHGDPRVVHKALQEKLEKSGDFFKKAPVVVNVASLNSGLDWVEILDVISSTGMQVVGVSGCRSSSMKTSAELAGLPILKEGKVWDEDILSPERDKLHTPHAKSLVIDRPVRSGQRVYAKQSNLIVINNVSAGAELVADGSIHIYGMMRGRALAGANNDQSSQIFCTKMAAELISIAGEYWVMDQISNSFLGKATRVYLSANGLNIHHLS